MSSNEEMGSADNGFEEVAKPHCRGHRERLRKRFLEGGGGALPDYELLELMLFRAMPRRDTNPLAKAILARFGTFADEVQQEGTVEHMPVYIREVVKWALELSSRTIVLVHNHPSGDPTPSRAEIVMTKQIVEAAEPLGELIHENIVVDKQGHASFRGLGLI